MEKGQSKILSSNKFAGGANFGFEIVAK